MIEIGEAIKIQQLIALEEGHLLQNKRLTDASNTSKPQFDLIGNRRPQKVLKYACIYKM